MLSNKKLFLFDIDGRGVEPERKLSNRIGVPTSWKKAGLTSCKEHMRGGIFSQMTPEKQVSFIERVEKSVLGLHGLQIVVYCDKNRTGTLSEEKRKKCTAFGNPAILMRSARMWRKNRKDYPKKNNSSMLRISGK